MVKKETNQINKTKSNPNSNSKSKTNPNDSNNNQKIKKRNNSNPKAAPQQNNPSPRTPKTQTTPKRPTTPLSNNSNKSSRKNSSGTNATTGSLQSGATTTLSSEIQTDSLLGKKSTTENIIDADDGDSSDEELVVRTGNVPRKWYDDMEHSGYDINANKVIKPKKEDEIEKFMKQAEDKNWWRNIYDEMNNKTIYISDKDMELIKRVRKNMFANQRAEENDFFEEDIPYQLHPVSTNIPSKKAFGMSYNERKAINRLKVAIENGFIKLDDNEEMNKFDQTYDLWQYEDTDPNKYHPGKGYLAPKRELPDTDLSYNPPDEILDNEGELKQHSALRKIPKYDKLLDENFDRCCDLVMGARVIKKKSDLKEEDILPNLPKPEELKPFPNKEAILFRGHESSIRAMAIDPCGKFLISGDNGGFIHFWDIQTAKVIKRMDIDDTIVSIAYNSMLNLITICGKQHIYFTVPYYLEKSKKVEITKLVANKILPLIPEVESEQQAMKDGNEGKTTARPYTWKIPKKNSVKEKNGVLFYLKWNDGNLDDLIWHPRGDYFATLSKSSLGRTQVFIHSLSRMIHQTPFSKIKGNINSISFHPTKPYFLVATNSNIFVYNLQKQETVRKFVSNLNTITTISVHKNGDDILAGTKDGKVAWFQLELSDKPYKVMDYHGDKIKNVAFHQSYPLFISCSRNGKLLVYHATIQNNMMQDPVIVPLKVLKPNSNNGVLSYSCFHPKHPWVFTSGEDHMIRMWV